MEQENGRCIVCGELPDDGIHVSGIKFIKGQEEPYNLCKPCCLGRGKVAYSDQVDYKKKLLETVEKKIKERRKKG
jgi:hypothetical protein